MAQLDGSDIVYTARVPVPKIIALAVNIGTRFPAAATSMGRVLLADLEPDELDKALDTPSISGVVPRVVLSRQELDESLELIRSRGWALSTNFCPRRSVCRRPRCQRRGPDRGRDERDCSRRRNQHRDAHQRIPAAPARHRGSDQP